MKLPFARPSAALPLLLCVVSSAPITLLAQDVLPNSKVLVVAREFTKPGRDHGAHEKTEAGFVSASAASKVSSRYFAATSLSGPQRALFFYAYPSFAAWEAENKAIGQDTTLTTALDAANLADGDLLSSSDQSVWVFRDDMSLNPGFRVGARLEEITSFMVKPGHDKDWEDLVKLVKDAYQKGVPDAHWGMWQEAYGSPGDGYIVIVTMKSAAEIDANFASGKKFVDAVGPDGMKKMAELEASCIESEQTNLFMIDPKMSYPSDAMIKAEPDFWKPKQ